jgi:predicted amidohydrolase
MRRPLTIAVAQPACIPHDVAANALVHAAVVRAAGARVVVFPELSLTGYELDADPLRPTDPRLAPLVDAAAASGALVLAGAPVEGTAGRPHIAALAIDASGARVAYRKMWLGGAEPARFAPGPGPEVLDVDGWRLGLAVCRDTGVERHAADTAALGIDAYVAGVLEHDHDAHVIGERAVRIASAQRVPVAIASFAGGTGGGYSVTAGRSGVWSASGAELARAGREVGAVATTSLG